MPHIHPVDLGVIIPCFNEEENIPRLVERIGRALKNHPGGFELILVDDGSADGTRARVQEAQAAYPWVRGVAHELNRGIPESWATGAAASRAGRVVTMDADMQYRPEDIGLLIARMNDTGADIIQGWRRDQPDRGALRFVMTWVLSGILNLLFRMNLRDNKSGFLLCRKSVFEAVLDRRRGYRLFHNLVAVAAHGLGFRIEQIPVVFEPRLAGRSFIHSPVRYALRSLADLPRAVREFRRRS